MQARRVTRRQDLDTGHFGDEDGGDCGTIRVA
jgi:hypothetical protein